MSEVDLLSVERSLSPLLRLGGREFREVEEVSEVDMLTPLLRLVERETWKDG